MFERYTEQARRALFFARYEASQLSRTSIEPEHLLLGIVREATPLVTTIVDRAGLSLDSLRADLARWLAMQPGAPTPTSVEIPFAPLTKQALTLAAEEADRLQHRGIAVEHLLLAILRLEGPVSSFLAERGLRIESARETIAAADPTAFTAPPVFSPGIPTRPHRQAADHGDLMFEVRVSRADESAQGHTHGTNDTWDLAAQDLLSLVRHAYERFPAGRIDIDSSFDLDARYNVHVRGYRMSRERRSQLVAEGLEHFLDARIERETRTVDVYVMTATADTRERLGEPQPDSAQGSGFGTMSMSYAIRSDVDSLPPAARSFASVLKHMAKGFIGGVSANGSTIEEFGHLIEDVLGRPVLEETGLKGRYDIQLPEAMSTSHDEFFIRVRDQLGLTISPARRDVTFIVVRKN